MVCDERIIQSYADGDTYKKGLEYYKNNTMEDFTVSILPTDNSAVSRYSIDTWVTSDISDREYNVQVAFNDSSGFTSFHCDCSYFKSSYRRRGICKHLVAVLIKYFREKCGLVTKEKKELQTAYFLGKLEGILSEFNTIKKKINIEIHYFNYKNGRIKSYGELKVGCDRTYGVKDIEAFIEAIIDNKIYQESKRLLYNPKVHEFSGEVRAFIEFLKELYELNQINRIGADYSRNRVPLLEGKKFYIPGRQVKRLFKDCSSIIEKVTINGEELEINSFQRKDIPLSFNVYDEEGEVCITLQGRPPVPLDDNKSLFYYEGNVYEPSMEQCRLYELMCEALGGCETSTLRIKETAANSGYILSVLSNYSKELCFLGDMQRCNAKEELKGEAYVDRRDGDIFLKLIYRYGAIAINPLQEIQGDTYIIREVFREKKLQSLIEELGFRRKEDEYVLSSEKEQFFFLKEGCESLKSYCDIYYSDSFKALTVYNQEEIKLNIRLNKRNLIEINFSALNITKEELRKIFKLIKQNKRYYKLKNGNFLELENKELSKLEEFMERIGVKKRLLADGRVCIPVFKALAAEKLCDLMSLENVTLTEELEERLQELKTPIDFEAEVPTDLNGTLRDYQIAGFRYLKYLSDKNLGGVLADEMGLGKTIQTIAYLLSEKGKGSNLIVCPTSLCFNWLEEFTAFAPGLSVKLVLGNKEDREKIIKASNEYDVIITSYPLLRNDYDLYESIAFNSCIIDEAQYIKNHNSQNAVSVKRINSRVRFALTGTPIENSLGELWSIFDFIMPGYLFSYEAFSSIFLSPITKEPESAAMDKLNELIRPFIIRRVKKEVARELPDKINHKLIVGMTEEQERLYSSYAAASRKELRREIELMGFENNRMKILAVLTRLRQLCCYPGAFVEDYQGSSGKLIALRELTINALEQGHKILIFSQFTTVLKHILKLFNQEAIPCYYLDGSIKTEERYKLVEEFNSRTEPSVFLVSLKAGGTGLNLTGADIVVHFDPWWNPAVEEQATDRAHRIGQNNTVEVIKLITKGSIEEKIYSIQERKRELIENILSEERGRGFINSFTEEELLDLINL
ncbi:SNF2 helicase associated domain-containing protein [Alloiococcus sp. CFN-8]|uniref:SNF2 helicase associated domain-containing protein n=1 Tax=Alloiococcus sp. CFN-8 TaxID=3416081 RepID=UPI003CE8130D